MTDERTTDEREEPSAARQAADEPEPAWAERIRALRTERGHRLERLLGQDEPEVRP